MWCEMGTHLHVARAYYQASLFLGYMLMSFVMNYGIGNRWATGPALHPALAGVGSAETKGHYGYRNGKFFKLSLIFNQLR